MSSCTAILGSQLPLKKLKLTIKSSMMNDNMTNKIGSFELDLNIQHKFLC